MYRIEVGLYGYKINEDIHYELIPSKTDGRSNARVVTSSWVSKTASTAEKLKNLYFSAGSPESDCYD